MRKVGRRPRMPAVGRSLQILAALLLAVVVSVTAHELMQTRETLLDATAHEMARLDMVFAEQTGRAVETVDLAIRNVADSVPEDALGNPSTSALLRRRVEGVRQVLHIDIADATGRVIASSSPELVGTELPPAGKTALAWHRASDSPDMQISEPIRMGDQRWTALITRRISAPDGSFRGVTVAALNLAYFEDFYRAVELNENGAIMLHRRDGTVLARYPHVDSAVGTSFADLPPFNDVLAHGMAGTVIMNSPLDGTRRVLAIRALKAFPLAVNVSVDEARVLAAWRRQTWTFVVGASVACLAMAWLMLLLARRSRQIERPWLPVGRPSRADRRRAIAARSCVWPGRNDRDPKPRRSRTTTRGGRWAARNRTRRRSGGNRRSCCSLPRRMVSRRPALRSASRLTTPVSRDAKRSAGHPPCPPPPPTTRRTGSAISPRSPPSRATSPDSAAGGC